VEGESVFYNNKGPNDTSVKEGIYISCQPTGSSEEEVSVTTNKSQVNYDISSIFNDPNMSSILQIIIGIILCVAIFYILNIFYKTFILGKGSIKNLN
jgi:FlaG/FlaF family flagellin (archaellin)